MRAQKKNDLWRLFFVIFLGETVHLRQVSRDQRNDSTQVQPGELCRLRILTGTWHRVTYKSMVIQKFMMPTAKFLRILQPGHPVPLRFRLVKKLLDALCSGNRKPVTFMNRDNMRYRWFLPRTFRLRILLWAYILLFAPLLRPFWTLFCVGH